VKNRKKGGTREQILHHSNWEVEVGEENPSLRKSSRDLQKYEDGNAKGIKEKRGEGGESGILRPGIPTHTSRHWGGPSKHIARCELKKTNRNRGKGT